MKNLCGKLVYLQRLVLIVVRLWVKGQVLHEYETIRMDKIRVSYIVTLQFIDRIQEDTKF